MKITSNHYSSQKMIQIKRQFDLMNNQALFTRDVYEFYLHIRDILYHGTSTNKSSSGALPRLGKRSKRLNLQLVTTTR